MLEDWSRERLPPGTLGGAVVWPSWKLRSMAAPCPPQSLELRYILRTWVGTGKDTVVELWLLSKTKGVSTAVKAIHRYEGAQQNILRRF